MELAFAWVQRFADNSALLFLTIFTLSVVHTFFPPIPLESLTVFGSYIAGTGHGSPVLIWIATTAGMSAGSILMYKLTFFKGEALLNLRLLKKHLNPLSIAKVRNWFGRYGIWTIYLGKLISGMSFMVVFCCGLFKVSQRKVFIAIFCSNIFYYGILVLLGKFLGHKWEAIADFGSEFALELGILFLLIGLLVVYLYVVNKVNKKNGKPDPQD